MRGKIIAIYSKVKKQRLKEQQELETESRLQREHKQTRFKKKLVTRHKKETK